MPEVGKVIAETSKEISKNVSENVKSINIDKRTSEVGNNITKNSNLEKISIEKRAEIKKEGGSYDEIRGQIGKEAHHMPSFNSYDGNEDVKLKKGDGPSIVMDEADHRKTASFGHSLEAKEYRAKQAELIKNGKFDKAMQMDIDDIKSKFGNKYDKAIEQVKEYYNEIKKEGGIYA